MPNIPVPKTGFPTIDSIINFLRLGDNVVWQVENIQDYAYFTDSFVSQAVRDCRKVIYIRFAQHPPLLKAGEFVSIYELDASIGFESFSSEIHNIISREGKYSYYVFDSLSDLLSAWATDLMIGNFFMVTCPYLYELETITYFALLRNSHSFKTIARIRETTQILIDVYRFESKIYIHPLKVWNRYSPTMFLPHIGENDRFIPITNSMEAAKLFTYISLNSTENAKRNLDYWDRLFLEVAEMPAESVSTDKKKEMIGHICKIMMGREERILSLVQEYFTIEDLLQIKSRLIGTGYIGGKAVGMLLARNMLLKDDSFKWNEILEPHDSFFIGSDVFYSYIVQNGWWFLRIDQKTAEGYFEIAKVLKHNLLIGHFPEEIKEQFQQMLEYFGQSPIIVRSSSLLEDSFGNAFAGKYDSFFLVNQGSPEERYEQFLTAVKKIYASTMNEDALSYRLQRGLQNLDEQMALLVQRVSGSNHTKYFFPNLAGVGISYNTFVWRKDMNPKAGMLRLVYGLGTRAVNRVEDDYPRIVALDKPLLRPNSGTDDERYFSQHDVDVLNIPENKSETVSFIKLIKEETDLKIDKFATKDYETTQRLKDSGSDSEAYILTFDKLLSKTEFPVIMQRLMKLLEDKYEYPVDIEFTVNFTKEDKIQINLLQSRPLQTRGNQKKVIFPVKIQQEKIIFQTEGNFMGGNISEPVSRIVYIEPQKYGELNLSQKYDIARLIGKINHQIPDKTKLPTLLMGPGRWGTSTPSLGIPVSFSEINKMSGLCEMAYTIGGLIPELSFGTHFFQDLVETGIFYIALFPENERTFFNIQLLNEMPNITETIVPGMQQYKDVVKTIEFSGNRILLITDLISQKVLCYMQ